MISPPSGSLSSLLSRTENDPLIKTYEKPTHKNIGLRITIAVTTLLVVACSGVSIALINLVYLDTQDLNPPDVWIVSPGVTKFRPCVWPAGSGHSNHKRCSGTDLFCPDNYTCSQIRLSVTGCIAKDFECGFGQTSDCYNYFNELPNLDFKNHTKSINFKFDESHYTVAIVLQSISIILTMVLSIVVVLRNRSDPPNHRLPIYANTNLYVISMLYFLDICLIIGPGMLTHITSLPNFFHVSHVIELNCFENDPTWLRTYNELLMGIAACYCAGALFVTILLTALLSISVHQVYSGFWNSKSFVQTAVWCTLICGGLSLVLLVLS